MASDRIDISDTLTWEEDLPRPQWDLISAWIESRVDPEDRGEAWSDVARQWLVTFGDTLGPSYHVDESDHFVLLLPDADPPLNVLLPFAEMCREGMATVLGGVADCWILGKFAILALEDHDIYYQYLSVYYPEGQFGTSGGMQIREGRPHIVLLGSKLEVLEITLAHELTHAALVHLTLPPWVEEGLAQMFEYEMTGRALLQLDAEKVQRHKRYWGKHGLDAFWRGEGFGSLGKVQELSYQLAEILMRLLVAEHRPRWFGLSRERQRRFFAFLQEADRADYGEAAARQHLGFGLEHLAGQFLGQGEWAPGL